ncbi:hypothetical protein [Cytobacillus gottheilii]|uniref:Thiopeptide-type bacteriocin biosynthesis domain-containing protein n=1 Tax=Cytobacillus gottheilii TaxID=859144 RepID=A0ABX8FC91_9BACI|nr:hypothetical protein [Cytobacillus gottheilii]QVY61979.1 hypothetical protein J1899_02350 [Cytobacillus gottheilii]
MKEKEFQLFKIYIYESPNLRKFFYELLEILHNENHLFRQCILLKSWVQGPHFQLYYQVPSEEYPERVNGRIEELIRKKLSSYEDTYTDEQYGKYEQISERLALAERYTGDYLPLIKNHSIEQGTSDLSHIHSVYDLDLYKQIEIMKTAFFILNYSELANLNDEQRELLCFKFMIIAADQYEISFGDETYKGTKYGYLSFKSHYEGFLAQLQNVDAFKKDAILQKINDRSAIMDQFITEEFSSFVKNVEAGLPDDNLADFHVLNRWKEMVIKLKESIKIALDSNKVKLEEYHDIASFLNTSKEISQFHDEFVKDDAFRSFSKSKGFLTYRLLVNFLYQVFPFFNISPLQKNKLCKLISENAQDHYDFSWQDLKKLRGDSYEGDDIYQNIGSGEG